MPSRTATSYLLAAVFLLLGAQMGFAQCSDAILSVTVDNPSVRGNGTLTISEGSAILEIDLTDPCPTHLVAVGIVTADTVQINSSEVSLMGNCDGSSLNLSLTNPCGDGENYTGLTLSTGGSGGGAGGGDGSGGTGGDGNGNGNGNGGGGVGAQELDFRSGKGGTRPEAKLIGIEVEVNPSVVKLDDVGANLRRNTNRLVDDVTFTARLVFSDGAIPKNFKHKTGGWQFWPELEETNGRNENSWVDSMEANANMQFSLAWVPGLNDPEKEQDLRDGKSIEVDEQSVNVMFKMLPGRGVTGNRVKSKKIPIQVVYEDDAEKVKFSKTVNVQVERKATSSSFAGSSGPANRIVTYSRVLE